MRYHGATLVMHARHDDLVDVSHAERLFEWAAEPKTLKIFERGGHNDILFFNFDAYFESIKTFIDGLQTTQE
jgi:alpha-beta hydrolase superfamily lysophospholipase